MFLHGCSGYLQFIGYLPVLEMCEPAQQEDFAATVGQLTDDEFDLLLQFVIEEFIVCIKGEVGVLDSASVCAPFALATRSASTTRTVLPLEDSAKTNVCSSTA